VLGGDAVWEEEGVAESAVLGGGAEATAEAVLPGRAVIQAAVPARASRTAVATEMIAVRCASGDQEAGWEMRLRRGLT
jgi:hypothetical protein